MQSIINQQMCALGKGRNRSEEHDQSIAGDNKILVGKNWVDKVETNYKR
jgi:hypothetical protein